MRLSASWLIVAQALSLVPLAGLGACAATDFTRPGPVQDAASYNRLYPDYVELCAVSGIDKRPGFGAAIHGGPGGHSVLFLHGACRDRDQLYPTLRLCRPGDPPGAGVSANSHFSNANWVASDGPDFLFDGMLRPGQALTRAAYRQTQNQAEQNRLLDGIRFHDWVFADKPARVSRRDWTYEVSVSTDYAVDFGRGRLCGRLPVSRARMARIVAALNARNAAYRGGKPAYVWNVLQNNCAHLTHNALAAAGLWPACPIERPLPLAALTFPVPKNEVMDLLHRANDFDLADLPAIFHDPLARMELLRDGVLPAAPGALLLSEPARAENEVYDPEETLIFYQDPVFGSFQTWLNHMQAAPRYHDVLANLEHFQRLYARIQAGRKPLAWWRAHHPALWRGADDFPGFYSAYYQAIDRDAAWVRAALLSSR